MTVMRESRTEKRAAFEDKQRVILLEQDADTFENAVAKINANLRRLLWVGVGGLVSFSTAVILLAVDIATRVGG